MGIYGRKWFVGGLSPNKGDCLQTVTKTYYPIFGRSQMGRPSFDINCTYLRDFPHDIDRSIDRKIDRQTDRQMYTIYSDLYSLTFTRSMISMATVYHDSGYIFSELFMTSPWLWVTQNCSDECGLWILGIYKTPIKPDLPMCPKCKDQLTQKC